MSDRQSSSTELPDQESVPLINLAAQYESLRDEMRAAVDGVFESQAFVLGEEVRQLEEEIARYCDSRFAIGCASGTDALILSLIAVGVGAGDEVITSPFTFFATAGAIHRVGATPVFVDIDHESFNLCPEKTAAAITNKTAAIIPVHLFGQCADMEPLWRLSVRHKLPLIEDACQAIGAEYRGRRAGVLGTLGCFSFFPTKNLGGAGDGGVITTDDYDLAQHLRRLRVHGDIGGYRHLEVGFNSRLDALQAAVLRVKLRHLEAWTEGRRANAKVYGELFRGAGLLDSVHLPVTQADRRHVFNQYTVRVRNGHRDQVLQSLRSQQIGCAVYYPLPLHQQECFAHMGYEAGQFPESEKAAAEVLSLPIFPELTSAQQNRVVSGVATAVQEAVSGIQQSGQSESRRAA